MVPEGKRFRGIVQLENYMITFIISLALFMEALDTTIINTAIPVMSYDLCVSPIDLKIALISYLVSLAVFIPISGWLADKYGIKRVFIAALGVFTLSSMWCGFANNLPELVVARAIQGIGGSLALPVGRLILFRTFARHDAVIVMSRVVMVAGLGMMLGPVLGGIITHHFSWRWIFWVNIPVGIVAILLACNWLTDVLPQTVPPLDKLGFLLFGTSLAGFVFGLAAFSESTINSLLAAVIILAAFLLMIAYLWHSYGRPYPIVKAELFRLRTFRVSTIGNLISRLGFGGMPFLLPILLQNGLGYSSQLSGILLAPMALGVLLIKPLVLRALRFLGYKKLLMVNTILVSLSLWSFMIIGAHTSLYLIALLTFILGILVSMQYSGMNSLAYAEILPEQLSAATSIMSTLQQLAQSFGVAVGALSVYYFSSKSHHGLFLTTVVFHRTFFTIGVITLFSTFIFRYLRSEDGHQMIKHD